MNPQPAHHRSQTRAPGFTIVPLALVLWIALIILGVLLYLKAPPPNYVPAKGVGPGQIGSVLLALLYGGFWVVMLSPIAEKKGQAWANVVAVITLGFAGLMLGLSYAGLSADQRGLTRPGVQPPAVAAAAPVATPQRPEPSRPAQPLQPRDPAPATPSPDLTPKFETRPPRPSAVIEAQPVAPAPPEPAEHPAIAQRTAAMREALDKDIAAVVALARQALPPLLTHPKHDLRALDAHIQRVEAFSTPAQALSAALRKAQDTLRDQLQADGVSVHDATSAAIRFSADYGAMPRAFACDALLRTCDRARTELAVLKAEFSRWRIQRDGSVKWTSDELRRKAETLRFFVEADIARFEEESRRLQTP